MVWAYGEIGQLISAALERGMYTQGEQDWWPALGSFCRRRGRKPTWSFVDIPSGCGEWWCCVCCSRHGKFPRLPGKNTWHFVQLPARDPDNLSLWFLNICIAVLGIGDRHWMSCSGMMNSSLIKVCRWKYLAPGLRSGARSWDQFLCLEKLLCTLGYCFDAVSQISSNSTHKSGLESRDY